MRVGSQGSKSVLSFGAGQWLLCIAAVAGLFAMHVLTVSVGDCHSVADTTISSTQSHPHGSEPAHSGLARLGSGDSAIQIGEPANSHGNHEALCVAVFVTVVLLLGMLRPWLRQFRLRQTVGEMMLARIARPPPRLFSTLSVMRL